MSIMSIKRNFNGIPNLVTIVCDNTFEEITTPGFLRSSIILNDISSLNNGTFKWDVNDYVIISYENSSIGLFIHDTKNDCFIVSLADSGFKSFEPNVSFITPGNLSVNYLARIGNYVKFGSLFICSIQTTFIPTYTTSSGAFIISGLPKTIQISFGGSVERIADGSGNIVFPAGRTFLNVVPEEGENYCFLRSMGSGVPDLILSTSNIISGNQYIMDVNLFYIG